MRPIKWKGIRSGLTICCQKISQTNLQSYPCIMKLKIINFWLFFKMRSRNDFPLGSSWFVCLWPTKKCRKTRSDIICVTNLLSESIGELIGLQEDPLHCPFSIFYVFLLILNTLVVVSNVTYENLTISLLHTKDKSDCKSHVMA